uniref:Uncharacterized protein LOC101504502 isoform X2 n=1 Tax=Cicer arietinum TaxID=3827 RepID=A0A1S2Y5W4_CICAR|nr:uncharacterized protein LOC101504502 isoform X2 [Cicer arietinum]
MPYHNGMHHNNKVVEDNEALTYQTYPCGYYVQSPSTLSHANSVDIRNNLQNDAESTFHSPVRSETHPTNPTHEDEPSRFALRRYSSSRGSSHSFTHHKKISYDGTATENDDAHHLVIVDDKGSVISDEEEKGLFDEYYYGKNEGGWKKYFSYGYSDSCAWLWLQVSWRIMIARIPEFKLGEGVDRTGVTTKILTCNCSMNLIVENESRFFGLHIRPPLMDMKFSILPFAFSNGPKLYAESGLTIFTLQLGVKNKAMYGAGRSMQDMLDSERGVPIVIQVTLSSSFEVVPTLVKPRFHHRVECIVVLKKAYNKKHRSQAFNSTCKVTS